jgi:putative flippase GtrA
MDSGEAFRFVMTGGIATLGNLAAVAIARGQMSYSLALICGIAVGMILSFFLTKFFAFRVRAWSSVKGETGRFLIVYCFGLLIYYLAAIQVRTVLVQLQAPLAVADIAGVLAGGALMAVTGYFGHRFFTYRTGQS